MRCTLGAVDKEMGLNAALIFQSFPARLKLYKPERVLN